MCSRDGPDPMFCSMRSTVCSRSSAVGLFERLHWWDGDINTSEAEFASGRECV